MWRHPAFLRFWRDGLVEHFGEEDDLLLPVLDGRPDGTSWARRLREEHAHRRSGFADLEVDGADLEALWVVASLYPAPSTTAGKPS